MTFKISSKDITGLEFSFSLSPDFTTFFVIFRAVEFVIIPGGGGGGGGGGNGGGGGGGRHGGGGGGGGPGIPTLCVF